MKYCYLFLLIAFYGCKTVSVSESIKVTENHFFYKVDSLSVSKTLKTLSSDEMQGRESGTHGGEKAANYLAALLQQYNVKPYFKTYRDTLSNFKETTFNIIGVIEGNDVALKNEYIILGAHYDHIGITKVGVNGDFINNGANDDASGVTAVAEIAKYFGANKTNKRSIIVAFFSAEEVGLLGSFHLAEKLKKQNVNLYTMLNFEMIGVPMQADHTAYITGFNKSNMAEKVNEYAGKKLVGYFPMEFQYQLFLRSDNFPFYKEFNVPCQTVCTFDFKNFDYYHHVQDEFELMNVSHMTRFIQEIIPVVEKMANTATKEVVLNK
ncbi:M20/M25/M40 family metallo-hydrolase [Flavobacterium sp.]|uniref:M28 family metallopeptidase n=1 Tax=Flavobacterium sp. TaxID=239 RepID=UPI0026206A3E|nr:M20/M25/M40 family metallo-hydrolase [Flavobacterium sp.]MDD3003478.1 M20/M25/M40 family metallo-hydrolase [Flavobacterium sp.]